MYIVGLSLCTMGNIASAEMSRDLSPEVEKLMGSGNGYIKKKVAVDFKLGDFFIPLHPSHHKDHFRNLNDL